MAFVVTEDCIRCKYMDCVEVCPIDCFFEGENMLVIHPDECISCGVCVPECSAKAILPDDHPENAKWLEHNREFSKKWPRITIPGIPPKDGDEYNGVSEKLQRFFSPKPAPR